MDDGAYEQAANHFEAAAAQDPEDPKGWWSLGVAALRANQVGRARDAFTKAALLRPADPMPRIRIGFTWELERNYEEAERAYRMAMEIAPQDAEPPRVLGSRLLRWGQAEAAVPVLEAAVRLGPSHVEGWNALALAQHRAGDHAAADATFLRGIAQLPGARRLYIGHAALLVAQGRLADAAAAYNFIVGKWPAFAPAHVGRGILLHELGAKAAAEAAFETAARVAENPAPYRKRLADYRNLRARTP